MSEKIDPLKVLSRSFLSIMKTRQSIEKRLQVLGKSGELWIVDLLKSTAKALSRQEDEIKKAVLEQFKGTRLYEWVKSVKGLGVTALLLFAGEINEEVESTGKVWAYWGFSPKGKRRVGQKTVGNPTLKGKMFYIANVAAQLYKDEYYAPLFQAKKDYYLNVRKERPIVAHHKAIYWTAKLLLGHAHELKRLDQGLDVSTIRSHHPYIPPKPYPTATPDPRILEAIRKGERPT